MSVFLLDRKPNYLNPGSISPMKKIKVCIFPTLVQTPSQPCMLALFLCVLCHRRIHQTQRSVVELCNYIGQDHHCLHKLGVQCQCYEMKFHLLPYQGTIRVPAPRCTSNKSHLQRCKITATIKPILASMYLGADFHKCERQRKFTCVGEIAQLVKCLPKMQEALCLIFSTT